MTGEGTSELGCVQLAIVSNSLRHRQHLQQVLERQGLRVVFNEPLSPVLLNKLGSRRADVLLLDVDEHMQDHALLERLLEESDVPIIFNDASGLTFNEPAVLAKWYGKLLGKIAEITGRLEWEELDVDLGWQPAPEPSGQFDLRQQPAREVWVLGASLGGPDALKQFLGALPADLPVAFVIAQHMGDHFHSLLAGQLDRATPLRVAPARVGHVLRHGEALVVPTRERLRINPIGAVELLPMEASGPYSPSIDTVMADLAGRYGARCHAIVFSGMCDDGLQGTAAVAAAGGEVWTQSAESCVISNMPDKVREAGLSGYAGTPRQLAGQLIRRYQN